MTNMRKAAVAASLAIASFGAAAQVIPYGTSAIKVIDPAIPGGSAIALTDAEICKTLNPNKYSTRITYPKAMECKQELNRVARSLGGDIEIVLASNPLGAPPKVAANGGAKPVAFNNVESTDGSTHYSRSSAQTDIPGIIDRLLGTTFQYDGNGNTQITSNSKLHEVFPKLPTQAQGGFTLHVGPSFDYATGVPKPYEIGDGTYYYAGNDMGSIPNNLGHIITNHAIFGTARNVSVEKVDAFYAAVQAAGKKAMAAAPAGN